MNRSARLRRFFFWFTDELRGRRIKSHFNEINYILNNLNSQKAIKFRKEQLSNLLKHASTTTSFYKNFDSDSIENFPVINKQIIKSAYNEIKSGNSDYQSALKVVTSGSTGTPFSIDQDKRKKERNTADTIYFGELAGYSIGQKLYYFKIWNIINRKNKISDISRNIIPVDVRDLSEQSITEFVNTLRKNKSPKAILAYASVLDRIAGYLSVNNSTSENCNIKAIIGMSESFSNSSRELLGKHYQLQPVSRYSNVENGIIAQQLTDGSDEFLINEASYLIEILAMDSNEPVPEGKPGRIVVTDLFNYCMPMIRYDTGDIGILEKKEVMGNSRNVFKTIEGRRMDMIFDTSGSLVSSFVITNNMWKYMEIDQYQFIQTSSKDYVFKLNVSKPFPREKELISEFRSYFGDDSNISIEYVSEIPLLESGKRKKVLNLSR